MVNPEIFRNPEPDLIYQRSLFDDTESFLVRSENPIYTKSLLYSIDEEIKLLARYPDKTNAGFMLVGSLARYLSGHGDIDTNWKIRKKADNMKYFINNPTHMLDFARISGPDQDMDTTFVFNDAGSLESLYAYIKANVGDAVENITYETSTNGVPIQTTYLDFIDKHNTKIHLEYGPICTNPNVIHMTMGFFNDKERVFHIDIAEYPKDGIQAENQNRLGGNTILAQDVRLPIYVNGNDETMYTLDLNKRNSLFFKERINIDEKPIDAVMELAIRALRIHLIHSDQLFYDSSFTSLTPLFFTKGNGNLFDLRKGIQGFIRAGEKLRKEKNELLKTELLICMAYDPYETAKFLHDTGLYLLFPGLRTFTHADWKRLYTSNAFTFLRDGTPIINKDVRSIENVQYSHEYFQRVRWNRNVNGIKMFIRAFGEVMKTKITDLDINNYDQMYTLLFTTESTAPRFHRQFTNLPNALIDALKTYPSGVTEREIQEYVQSIIKQKITREEFQVALFTLKQKGYIDRHNRWVNSNTKVVFYTPRLNKNGHLDTTTISLRHLEIKRAIANIQVPNGNETKMQILEEILQLLPCTSVESFRALRENERNLLVNLMEEELKKRNDITFANEDLKIFISEVQRACINFSRKRGL